MPENGTIAYIEGTRFPICQLCSFYDKKTDTKATHDVRTKEGRWAFVCDKHRESHAMHKELGIGKGQKLELHPDLVASDSDPAGQS